MSLYTVRNGIPSFGEELTKLSRILNQNFISLAEKNGAKEVSYNELVEIEELKKYEYFENFPHLAGFVSPLKNKTFSSVHKLARVEKKMKIKESWLSTPHYCIPSSTCHRVYSNYCQKTIENDLLIISISGKCYRNEAAYKDLCRLRLFTMREVVYIGNSDKVKKHMSLYEQELIRFIDYLKIPYKIANALDPFFNMDGSKARTQQIFPLKKEITYKNMAIGSINYHRNFFGEKAKILLNNKEYAYSGCIGVGIERWIHVLLALYTTNEAVELLSNYPYA